KSSGVVGKFIGQENRKLPLRDDQAWIFSERGFVSLTGGTKISISFSYQADTHEPRREVGFDLARRSYGTFQLPQLDRTGVGSGDLRGGLCELGLVSGKRRRGTVESFGGRGEASQGVSRKA